MHLVNMCSSQSASQLPAAISCPPMPVPRHLLRHFADMFLCTAASHCSPCSMYQPLLCWLQTARLHFGVILGWSCMASISIWFVVNSMVSSLCA